MTMVSNPLPEAQGKYLVMSRVEVVGKNRYMRLLFSKFKNNKGRTKLQELVMYSIPLHHNYEEPSVNRS